MYNLRKNSNTVGKGPNGWEQKMKQKLINFKVIEDKMNKKILQKLKNNDSKLKTLN